MNDADRRVSQNDRYKRIALLFSFDYIVEGQPLCNCDTVVLMLMYILQQHEVICVPVLKLVI